MNRALNNLLSEIRQMVEATAKDHKFSESDLVKYANDIGFDYKAGTKKARALGRTFAGKEAFPYPKQDPEFEALLKPVEAGRNALDGGTAARSALWDIETKLSTQWKGGQNERKKAVEQASDRRWNELSDIASGQELFALPGYPEFYPSKIRRMGFPKDWLQSILDKTTDPAKQERLQKMIALKDVPLKLDPKFVR